MQRLWRRSEDTRRGCHRGIGIHPGYLRRADSIIDPWGGPYGYRQPGTNGAFDLYSLGADGQEGGEDEEEDITSW